MYGLTIVGFENNNDIEKNKNENKILINLYSYIYMNINLEHYIIIIIIFAFIYLKYESSCNKRTIEKMSSTDDKVAAAKATNDIKAEINKIYKEDIEHIRNLAEMSTILQTKDGLIIPNNVIIKGNLTLDSIFSHVQPGSIFAYNGTVAPSSWAICDGQNGTPDLRGRFITGHTKSITEINNKGGENKHKLSIKELASHDHKIINDGNHRHSFNLSENEDGSSDDDFQSMTKSNPSKTTSGAGSHNHGGSTGYVGSNYSYENRPPYYVLMYIMKK